MRSLRSIMPEWITVEVKWDAVEKFKAITRGKPTVETAFRRIIQRLPRVHVPPTRRKLRQSAAMDGIFPPTTNTKEKPVDADPLAGAAPRLFGKRAAGWFGKDVVTLVWRAVAFEKPGFRWRHQRAVPGGRDRPSRAGQGSATHGVSGRSPTTAANFSGGGARVERIAGAKWPHG
jgi:hypothetical protein